MTSKKETEETEHKERIIVAPGEVVAKGMEFLPGEGTRREGNDIVAIKFGLLEKQDKLMKVIPLSGAYIPRVGNVVIGEIIDVTFNGWIVDIASPHLGFLPITEVPMYVNKDLTEYYDFHDNIVAKIKAVKSRGIDLTMKDKGKYKKLEGGMIIQINPTRVPRIIGRAGSMVNVIKEETGCSIIVGQNGIIWIKGKTVDDELLAKEAIDYIVEKPFIEGLTEKIKEFLQKKKKEKE
ncbi:MAG: exosome complex RNA-binding protein Rrp4 [Candidatus Pacearchaeota archaeon]